MRSLARDNCANRPEQNLKIKPEPAVADVGDVEPQAGVEIDVRVIPRAGKTASAGTRDGSLLIRVAAPPVERWTWT